MQRSQARNLGKTKYRIPTSSSESPYYIDETGGTREQPGLKQSVRMAAHKEAYCYVDPDLLADLDSPPEHVQAAFEEVFGDRIEDPDGRERLKLRVHPHFRRWCLYERALIPELGDSLWKVVWIAQDEPVKGHLPEDLKGDIYKAHFTGMLGDYKEPDKADFELVEQFDKKKYGVNAVNELAGKLQETEEAALEEYEAARTEDFLDYYWNMAYDEANQEQGSGQHMRSVASVKLKANIERYRHTRKNGYTLIERKSKAEWLDELAEVIVSTLKETERAVLKELLKEKLAGMDEALVDRIAEMTKEEAKDYVSRVKQERHRLLAANGMVRKTKVL